MTNAFAVEKSTVLAPIGKFSFSLPEERWSWTPAVAALHGYDAREMTPTTATVLSHVHHADRSHAFAVMAKMAETWTPVSRKIRILDVRGETRHVVVLGSRAAGAAGDALRTSGLYVDITDPYSDEVEHAVAERRHRSTTEKPRIDRATGMLMVMYGISADRAFDLLVWRSQDTGTDVSVFADRLLDAIAGDSLTTPPVRERFDHLLLTAHTPLSWPTSP